MEPVDQYPPQQPNFDGPRNGGGPPRNGGGNVYKVFVGNLSYKTSWQRLKDHFKTIGNVGRTNIFEDRQGRSKGCGLVEFFNMDDCQKAISSLNGSDLDGRNINVREDNPEAPRSGPPKRDMGPGGGRRDGPPGRDRKPRRRSYSRSRSSSYSRDSRKKGGRRSYSGSRSRSSSYSSRSSSRRGGRRRSNERRSRSRDNYKRRGGDRQDNRGGPRKFDEKGFQIIVKNLPWSVSWQQLKDAFREYGSILRADVPQDKQGRSAGYGFIRFDKEQDAQDAIKRMDGASFNGRKITVANCHN